MQLMKHKLSFATVKQLIKNMELLKQFSLAFAKLTQFMFNKKAYYPFVLINFYNR